MPVAYHNPDMHIEPDEDVTEYDAEEVVQVLMGYSDEAEEARRSGANPRDQVWRANWDRYWGRYTTQGKADWQSKHVMPESPTLVDRFAAAMREALDGGGGEFFTAVDAAGNHTPLQVHVTKAMRVLLSRCSRTVDGHVVGFSSVFEEQMKLGALMACCAGVTWEEDTPEDGWVRVNTVDPREVWYDPKARGLYRKRKYEIDKSELMAMAKASDDMGDSLYDIDEIMALLSNVNEERRMERERSSGGSEGKGETVGRKPIQIEEWLCTIIMPDGNVVADKSLVVIANDRFIIRGPEPNPFWHERDWIAFCPMISVPLSVYGRTYMEDWADVADAFVELTNLILDGVFVSTIKAFVANPSMLDNPEELAEGVSPNKIFTTSEEITDVRRFIAQIDLGQLPNDAYQIWNRLKSELQEGAKLNEIALGQMAPKGRTTATEIMQTQQSGSSMIRSIARNLEDRFLEPVLNMIWQTALQHMDFMVMADQIGEEAARMLNERRDEFASSGIAIQVRGLSGLIDRQAKLQNLLSAIQIIGQNEMMLKVFMEQISPRQLLDQLFSLFGLDMKELEPTQMEQMQAMLTQQQPQPGQEQPGDNQDLVS